MTESPVQHFFRAELSDAHSRAVGRLLRCVHPCFSWDIIMQILEYAGLVTYTSERQEFVPAPINPPRALHPAETPLGDGRCPFLQRLPAELRRLIFAESLPAKDVPIEARCKDDSRQKSKAGQEPKHNKTSDLMTLSKKLCDEIAVVVYEERTFEIHVHEGIKDGGIEFLSEGRQPLQYKDTMGDSRFNKFRLGEAFGFDRLKKIKIVIFPSQDDCKHTPINTYFMIAALCRMLDRPSEGGRNRITSLNVGFASPQGVQDQTTRLAIQKHERYWWDPDAGQPRETSVHNLSNIELVLRAFSTLTYVHKASISLPAGFHSHVPTAAFVTALEASMMSPNGTLLLDDDLEFKIETARSAMEEYVLRILYGGNGTEVPRLDEDDMAEDTEEQQDTEEQKGMPEHKSDDSHSVSDEEDDGDDDRNWVGGCKRALVSDDKRSIDRAKRF